MGSDNLLKSLSARSNLYNDARHQDQVTNAAGEQNKQETNHFSHQEHYDLLKGVSIQFK